MPEPKLSPDRQRALRDALGLYTTGVAVVTARSPEGGRVGLTINSFASVSLDPPLVLWSLSVNSPNLEAFEQAGHFSISVLADDQAQISQRFASRADDKFEGVALAEGLGGAPLVDGCCASFECHNEFRYPGGDHVIFVGRVERFAADAGRSPLVFQGGRYRRLAD